MMRWFAAFILALGSLTMLGCPTEEPTPTDDDDSTEEVDPLAMTDAEFEAASAVYFERCAGCHGTLRTGATGPALTPEASGELGTAALVEILTNGTDAGMPPFGQLGILSEDEIRLLSIFIQKEPPTPPALPIADITTSWNLIVPVADRPTQPVTTRNWENYFGVILRDAGQVAIMDGDTFERVALLDTGYAVHILRSSKDGRYFYTVGRDGRVTMIDLWPETPATVAEVKGCIDARSVDASKYTGYEGQYLIEGCYWPPQYVVFDGQTLEPLADVVSTSMNAVDGDQEFIEENRVAAIVASHTDPVWVVNLKESGHVAIVDYSDPTFPMTATIGTARYLHDGGFDSTGRYFMTAANASNKMVIVDVQDQELEAIFETGAIPHPGRGANWEDPTYGWVNATTHIGEGKMTVYGADPANNPNEAWQIVREVEVEVGGLFVKTHNNSPWVWVDSPLNSDSEKTRQICVYEKATGTMNTCMTPVTQGRTVHFEYNADGTQVWVSGWDAEGTLVIFDDATLTEVGRVDGDWLVTPTGKFNVTNTKDDIY